MKTLIALSLIALTINHNAHAGAALEGLPLINTLECVSLDENSELVKGIFQTNGFSEQMFFTFETLRATPFAARLRNSSGNGAVVVPSRIGHPFDPVASFHLPLHGGKGTVTLKEVGVDQEDSDLEVVNVNCRRL